METRQGILARFDGWLVAGKASCTSHSPALKSAPTDTFFQFPLEGAMHHLLQHSSYPQHQNFNEMSLRLTHQPFFMRLKEYHSVSTNQPAPFPPKPISLPQENDDLSEWSDLSMRNAWFPGGLGSVNFVNHRHPPRNSLLYTPSGEPKNVLLTIEGRSPAPGTVPTSPYPQEANAWLYQVFNRRLDAELRAQAEKEGIEYHHPGHENCEMCREREELVRRGMELDDRDHESISEAYKEDWRTIERMFENVGLGRDQTRSEDDMDEDEDFEEDEADDELDFLYDPNANPSLRGRPVRRATDRAKIERCDGIKDIVFCGTVRIVNPLPSFRACNRDAYDDNNADRSSSRTRMGQLYIPW